MNKIQTFRRTLIPSSSKIQVDVWDSVVELHEQGKHSESILRFFDYIDKDLKNKHGNADKTEFNVPHGSVVVNISIKIGNFNVNVPFLKLPEKSAIPILRKVNEINFSPLTLSTIVLEGDELRFKFSSPVDLTDPWKIYNVLREICINADNYDDEFIQKFHAIRIHEPKVINFPDDKKTETWNSFQFLLSETKEYLDYFDNKRLDGFVWDVLLQLFLNIDYIIAPQGVMRTDLEEVVGYMQNSNYSLHEKIEKGRNFYKKLQQVSQDQLYSNLYISDIFIPVKYTASIERVRETFTHQYETAKKEMANADYMGAALSIRYVFLYEFYYAYPPAEITETITRALEESSGKSWEDAARILWQAIDKIMGGSASSAATQPSSSGWSV